MYGALHRTEAVISSLGQVFMIIYQEFAISGQNLQLVVKNFQSTVTVDLLRVENN